MAIFERPSGKDVLYLTPPDSIYYHAQHHSGWRFLHYDTPTDVVVYVRRGWRGWMPRLWNWLRDRENALARWLCDHWLDHPDNVCLQWRLMRPKGESNG